MGAEYSAPGSACGPMGPSAPGIGAQPPASALAETLAGFLSRAAGASEKESSAEGKRPVVTSSMNSSTAVRMRTAKFS